MPDEGTAPPLSADSIPGAWPGGLRPSHHASLHRLESHLCTPTRDPIDPKQHTRDPASSKSEVGELKVAAPTSPSHRSPLQVMSDLVRPKPSDSRETKLAAGSTSPMATKMGSKNRTARMTVKQPTSKSTKADTHKVLPLPDIRVKPYHTTKPSKSFTNAPSEPLYSAVSQSRSTTPTTPLIISPQSSPSLYSQDEEDTSSEGTVSSDEDARSLLALADSGPKRVAPLNIRKKSVGPDQQRVERARQMMLGKDGGLSAG